MSKILLAAGLVRDFEFSSAMELIRYVNRLDQRGVQWEELGRFSRPDGTVIIRILSQYNNADLIQL